MLSAKGIGYDTGFNVDGARSQPLDSAVIQRELQIIRDDLHCTAVRLIGNDMDQLEVAARHAASLGLETWINLRGLVVYDGATPVGLNVNLVRNETEQSAYLRDLLDVFTTEGVNAAFACTFITRNLPHRADPRLDLDMASWGIVKVFEDRHGATYPDMTWEPKEAFGTVAQYYRTSACPG